jgi:hypothetical protein
MVFEQPVSRASKCTVIGQNNRFEQSDPSGVGTRTIICGAITPPVPACPECGLIVGVEQQPTGSKIDLKIETPDGGVDERTLTVG